MTTNKHFDHWAGNYDEHISSHTKGYPFEGYYDVLAFAQSLVTSPKGKTILDIGVGTGLLSQELYKQGAKVYGLDFSQKMLEKAADRMPNATFIQADFSSHLPTSILEIKFDYIVSAYALHHVSDTKKAALIKDMATMLNPNGKIIVADIAFLTTEDRLKCQKQAGMSWDSDEYYIAWDEFKRTFSINGTYTQVSACAGILKLSV